MAAANASSIAAGTVDRSIMLACAATPSRTSWDAYRTHPEPVWDAARPAASTMPTCRIASPGSDARTAPSASPAGWPSRISRSPFGPWAISVYDWVATAPTPGSTHGTPLPTLNQRLWTATPSSPVFGSRATIEYVMGHLGWVGGG